MGITFAIVRIYRIPVFKLYFSMIALSFLALANSPSIPMGMRSSFLNPGKKLFLSSFYYHINMLWPDFQALLPQPMFFFVYTHLIPDLWTSPSEVIIWIIIWVNDLRIIFLKALTICKYCNPINLGFINAVKYEIYIGTFRSCALLKQLTPFMSATNCRFEFSLSILEITFSKAFLPAVLNLESYKRIFIFLFCCFMLCRYKNIYRLILWNSINITSVLTADSYNFSYDLSTISVKPVVLYFFSLASFPIFRMHFLSFIIS